MSAGRAMCTRRQRPGRAVMTTAAGPETTKRTKGCRRLFGERTYAELLTQYFFFSARRTKITKKVKTTVIRPVRRKKKNNNNTVCLLT